MHARKVLWEPWRSNPPGRPSLYYPFHSKLKNSFCKNLSIFALIKSVLKQKYATQYPKNPPIHENGVAPHLYVYIVGITAKISVLTLNVISTVFTW